MRIPVSLTTQVLTRTTHKGWLLTFDRRTAAAPPRRAGTGSYSPSVNGMRWSGLWSGWFEAGRQPGVAVEQIAQCVEFADAPFSGGGQVGLY